MGRAPLLERKHLIRELRDRLAVAGRGSGTLIFLAGEAGAGKTAVVDEFAAQVGGRATVLSGACDPLTTPRPLSPLLDIADNPTSGLPDLARDLSGPTAWFGVLLDRLKGTIRPTVVVMEDVHWADDATLDFLRYIGRRIGDSNALVLCTYRDDELVRYHPLQVLLGDLATSRTTVHLAVEPLSVAAVSDLSAGREVDPEYLHRLTGGNPFFLTEVLATGDDVPRSVQEAVLAQVSRLGDGARRVVDAVSIAPRQLEVGYALELSGANVEDADETTGSGGVLVGAGEALRFRHELARAAVAESLPIARRLLLHRRMLDLLTKDGAHDLARLAHHAVLAEAGEQVVQYAPEAARGAASKGAHREAASFYQMAIDRQDYLDEASIAEFRTALADELFIIDENEAALRQRELVVDHYRTKDDPARLGWALIALARSYWLANRHSEHRTAIARALQLLRPLGPTAKLGQAYYEAGFWSLLYRRHRATVDRGSEALDVARQVGEDAVAAKATVLLGLAEILFGTDLERGLELAREGLRHPTELGDRVAAHRGMVHLGWALTEARRYALAAAQLKQVVEVADFDFNVDLARTLLARIAFEQGRWDDAIEHAEQVLASATPGRSPLPLSAAHAVLGRVAVRRGDHGGGPVLAVADELADGASLVDRYFLVSGLAELAWLEGRTDQIPDLLESLYEDALAADSAWACGEIGYWMWRAGVIEQPPESAAEPYARQMRGDWAGSAAAWRTIGCPYEEALALADGDSAAQLAAVEILDNLGARPAAALVRARLRDKGVTAIPRGPQAAARAHPAGLTVRQAEVLALMADGLSNDEIAGRLFIASKTVEHHVSAIFAKLGVTNRAQAIVKVGELSGSPTPQT